VIQRLPMCFFRLDRKKTQSSRPANTASPKHEMTEKYRQSKIGTGSYSVKTHLLALTTEHFQKRS
jgi:hypothetical protein